MRALNPYRCLAMAGAFLCMAAGAFGAITFTPANTTISPGVSPTVTLGNSAAADTPVSITDGTSITLKVVATKPPGTAVGLSYQWFKNGVAYTGAGATTSSIKLSAVKASDSANYEVLVKDASLVEPDAFSANVILTVNMRPKIKATGGHPVGLTVNQDAAANFTVTLESGTPPFTFQWQRNNNPGFPAATFRDIPGGTFVGVATLNNTFTIAAPPGAQWSDIANYRCLVSNPGVTTTSVTSNAAPLKVNSAAVIVQHPVSNLFIATGATGVLKVVAGGNPTLKYQWLKNGNIIDKATSPTLNIKGNTAGGVDTYKVQVTNQLTTDFAKAPALSNDATVTTYNKPTLTADIAAAPLVAKNLYLAGANVTLSVVANANNTGTLTYQWQKDGKNIVGATNATLVLNPITWQDRGAYKCIVKNEVGTVTSKVLTIGVNSPPIVLSQTNTSVLSSCAVTNGSPNVTCTSTQFLAAGMVLTGPSVPAGARVLSVTDPKTFVMTANAAVTAKMETWITQVALTNCTVGDGSANVVCDSTAGLKAGMMLKGAGAPEGARVVSVTDGTSFVMSVNASGNIAGASWTAEFAIKGAAGGSVSLFVTAGGTSPFTYKWFRLVGGVPIQVGTAAKITISQLGEANEGTYYCEISNAFSGVNPTKSALVSLIVDKLPKIGTQPVNTKLAVTQTLNLAVVLSAGGDAAQLENPRFKWQRNNVTLVDGPSGAAVISGATTANLSIANIQMANAGSYKCIITNDVGTVTSAVATVTVIFPPTITTQPTDQTVNEDTNVSLSLVAAGSAPLKYQWEMEQNTPGGLQWVKLSGKTAATIAFNLVQLGSAGRYHCLVTNDTGVTVTSNDVTLAVNPVPAAVISNFFPRNAQGAEKVRVLGNNMNYVTEVKVGTATASFVIESPTALLFTVPGGAPLVATPFTLKTKHDVASSAIGFTRQTTFFNDEIVNSAILVGTQTTMNGSNIGHTVNGDGYNSFTEATTWFWWRAPLAGTYSVSVDGTMDASLSVYTGSPMVGYFGVGIHSSFIGSASETVSVTVAAANTDYLIRIGGSATGGFPTHGTFVIGLTRTSSPMITSTNFESSEGYVAGQSLNAQQAWQDSSEGGGAAAVVATTGDETQQAVRFGGDEAATDEAVVLFNEQTVVPDGAASVVSTFTMTLEAPPSTPVSDLFGWTLYDKEENPLAGLWLNAADGTLYVTSADGGQEHLPHKLVSGSPHHFEVEVDQVAGTWSASIDGAAMVSNSPLPAGALFNELCPVWKPSTDGSAHAAIVFDDLKVFAEMAE